jgi:hypothetical protein
MVNSSLTPWFVKISNNSKVTHEVNSGVELQAGFEVTVGQFEMSVKESPCY